MSESQLYRLASAVSDLHYDGGSENICTGFYEDIVRYAEDDRVEDVRENELHNVVLDPNVLLQAYEGTTWKGGFEVADERIFEGLDDVYGSDLAYHWTEKGSKGQVVGVFEDKVEPREVFENLGSLGGDVKFFYPDHTLDCLNGKYQELKRNFRNGDLEYEIGSFTETKQDINKVRGEIWTTVKDFGHKLPVMENSGSFENYSNANFNNKDFSEDDLIEDETEDLAGFSVVATFDGGFVDRDIIGLPPHLINQLWGE